MAKSRPTMVYDAESQKDIESIFGGIMVLVETAAKKVRFNRLLKQLLKDLEKDHRGYFDREADSDGRSWPPLSPFTIARKGHDTILVETGAMRASLTRKTSDAIRDVFTDGPQPGLVFGTGDEKAPFHQYGTRKMPARPPVGMTDERLDDICDNIADAMVDQIMDAI